MLRWSYQGLSADGGLHPHRQQERAQGEKEHSKSQVLRASTSASATDSPLGFKQVIWTKGALLRVPSTAHLKPEGP